MSPNRKRLLGSQVLIIKIVSKIILKQYKVSLCIERKRDSGRKKGFADQNKACQIIRTFLKHPNMSVSGLKWLKKLDFGKTH